MSEVIAALVGVIVGGGLGYVAERLHRRADRRADAYIDALATLQTARDTYARAAGGIGLAGNHDPVRDDFELNRISVRLEHDGTADAIAAYHAALSASQSFHEAMTHPVASPGDANAARQYAALQAFEAAVQAFARTTIPRD